MANLFLNIPVPAANGVGAPVDVSAMGKTKSLVCGGVFSATVNVEFSTDVGGLVWAPLATFLKSGNLTIDVAARWMRAVTSDYKGGASNLDVGSDDAGTLFAALPANGAQVDISALPLFKTAVAPAKCIVEISEDGVSWAQIFSFLTGDRDKSRAVVGKFARVSGGVAVTIAGAADGGKGEILVQDEGVPLGSFTTMNFVGTGVTAANGGGGTAVVTVPGNPPPEQLLSIYGDGSFGDYVTAGDETWTSVAGAPGAPVVPAGAPLPFAFFNNLTVSPGNSVAVGGFGAGENAIVIFVRNRLTIGVGGRIHANGAPGSTGLNINGNPGGAGRKAIVGSTDGAAGGRGGYGGAPLADGNGLPGGDGTDRPAQATATMVGGAGGNAQFQAEPLDVGGVGGVCLTPPSWPYSLSQAIGLAALLFKIGGGNGGGGGAGAGASGFGGGGGGGAGTLVIFAKEVVAPAGSLQAIGGPGGAGFSIEDVGAAGGGGATGGMVIVVTENATLVGVTDVSGGPGGAAAGQGTTPSTAGGPGEAVAFNPMLAAQIPA